MVVTDPNVRLFCAFTVGMKPAGKARPRFTRFGHAYTPESTARAEAMIGYAARNVLRGKQPAAGPVRVSITAYVQLPASTSKRKAFVMLGSPVCKKPDADNIAKLVLDALNGVAWVDDKQVYSVSAEKYYSTDNKINVSIWEWATDREANDDNA
jgi:Holliday junction resolvase RusA-like endonuclease